MAVVKLPVEEYQRARLIVMLMKRSLPLALAVLLVVVLAENSAHGQTRRRSSTRATPNSAATTVQKRRVILDLQGQDQPVSADLIEADARSVTVEIDGVRRVYKADDVIGIIFSPNEAEKKYPQAARTPESASLVKPALNPKDYVKVDYDEATDQTTVSTNYVNVYQDRKQAIAIGGLANFKGRTPPAQPLLLIVFQSVSDDWQYDYYYDKFGRAKSNDILQILIDGSPLLDFRMRALTLRNLGASQFSRRETLVTDGKATEMLSVPLTSSEFAELVKAQRAECYCRSVDADFWKPS
jgi:hypothetical protein